MGKKEYMKEYNQKPEVKEHHKEYKRQWYLKNKERIDKKLRQYYLENRQETIDRTRKWIDNNRERAREIRRKFKKSPKGKIVNKRYGKKLRRKGRLFFENYKKDKCCAFCGWKEHTQVLVFHHKDPKKKSFKIGDTGERGTINNTQKILNEINKCILLCPNCHQWLHSPYNTQNGTH